MKQSIFKSAASVWLILSIGLGGATLAVHAEERRVIEEIVVTASKRGEQTLLGVPSSIAAIDELNMERLQVKDFQDYADLVPGLVITAPTPGITKTTIRGLSSESVTSTVGVYLNETPITQNELDPDLKLFDVQRVEILRGPQGTLYGEGSLGGTVRIITNAPDPDAFDAGVEGSFSRFRNGDDPNYSVAGFLNVPLVEGRAALRGMVAYRDNASWIRNRGPGDAGNDEQTLTGRLALFASLTEQLDATVTYIGQRMELGGPRSIIDPSLGGLSRFTRVDESVDDDLDVFSLTLNWDLGFATLTSDTSYYERTQNTVGNNNATAGVQFFYNELSGASVGFPGFAQFGNPPGFPFVTVAESVVDFTGEAEQFTQELRLASNPSDNPLSWVVGVFYKDRDDYKDTYFSGVVTESPALDFSTLDIAAGRTELLFNWEQVAVFGEATYQINEQWEVTAGLRYSREKATAEDRLTGLFQYNFGSWPPTETPVVFGPNSDTYTAYTPRFIVAYHPTSDWTLYASASKGFRAGGYTGPTPFDPDEVWNYELGAKGVAWDGRLGLAAAAYQIDWSDVQTFDDIPDPPFFAVLNLGEARIRGLEVESTFLPADNWEIALALSYIDTEVTKVRPEATDPNLVEGNRMQKVPKFSGSLAATYTRPLQAGWNLSATGVLVHRGSAYSDFRNLADEKFSSYTTLAARIGAESERYSVFLFGRNLTDERIELNINSPGASVVGNAVGRPRLVGVEFKVRY